MATCDDRQLTEAQRQEGYQNQRAAGVVQAVRPFTGAPSLPNLVDYLNREVFPALKATRQKLNDVYRQVTDNAPSGNPLAYYFDTTTTNADPTAGRIRLDAATQNTATTLRVSETNGRLDDVTPWLDVMAGGATSPLGVVTLTDAINPARFIRFDLDSMVDQGTYWDLGVTVLESSHDNPFVDDGAVVLAFIPGVASTGATVPPTAISPVAANTVIANATASTAAPTAVAVGTNAVLGRVAGNIVAAQLATAQVADDAVTDAKLRNSGANSVIGRRSNTSGDPADIRLDEFESFYGTKGNFVLKSDSAGTFIAFGPLSLGMLPAVADGQMYMNTSGGAANPTARNVSALAGVGLGYLGSPNYNLNVNGSTSIIVDSGSDTVQRAALTGDVTASQNSNATTIANSAVTLAKMADMAQGTTLGRDSLAGTGAPKAMTGIQLGGNVKYDTFLQITNGPGTINDQAVNDGVKLIRVAVSSAGDLNITGFAFSAGNTGTFFRLFKQGTTGRVVLKHGTGSSANNQLVLPDSRDFILDGANEAVDIQYIGGRFQLLARNPATDRLGAPVYDVVLDYGAAGDGVTDDTTPIQNALTAAAATGGYVYLGRKHLITSTLVINGDGITLIGRGLHPTNGTAITFAGAGTSCKAIQVLGFAHSGVRDLYIEAANVYTADALLEFDGILRGFAINVSLTNGYNAIRVYRSTETWIRDFQIRYVLGDYGVVFEGTGTTHSFRCILQTGGMDNPYPYAIAGHGAAWTTGEAVVQGNIRHTTTAIWMCSAAGTTGASAPDETTISATTPTAYRATEVTDGTAKWRWVCKRNQTWIALESYASTLTIGKIAMIDGAVGIRNSNTAGLGSTSIGDGIIATEVEIDHPYDNGVYLDDGRDCMFMGGVVTSSQFGSGIRVGSAYGIEWSFIGMRVFGNAKHGVEIAAHYGKVQNCRIGNNGTLASNTYDAINVAAGVHHFELSDNFAGDIGSGSAHRYGIAVESGAGDNYAIIGNVCLSNVTGSILNSPGTATTRVVRNNVPDSMAGARVIGRQIDAAAGEQLFLTPAELGELWRAQENQNWVSIGPGTYNNWEYQSTQHVIAVNPSSGVVAISGFLNVGAGGGNAGNWFWLVKRGASTTTVRVLHQSTSSTTTNRTICPGGVDFDLVNDGDAVLIVYIDDTIATSGTAGTSARWQVISRATGLADGDKGDITVSSAGSVWTIDNDVVTNAKLRNSGALSVIGRSANSTGDPADISASAASDAVLRESGSTIGFGTIATGGIANDAVTNAKAANMAAATVKGRAIGAGTGDPTDLTQTQLSDLFRIVTAVDDTGAVGTYNNYVVAEGTKMVRINPTGSGDFIITGIALGSTNTGGWIRFFKQSGSGTDRVVFKHADAGSSANNQILCPGDTDFILDRASDAADFQFIGGRWQVVQRLINTTGLVDDAVTDAKLRNSGALSVIGRSVNSTGNPADISTTSGSGHVLRESGGTLGFGAMSGRLLARTVYLTGSGTHTYNAATTKAIVRMKGGGAGGGGTVSSGVAAGQAHGGGGGAGADLELWITSTPSSSAYAVGAGGTGASASAGTSGGDTTFHDGTATRTAAGGDGGEARAASTTSSTSQGGAGGARPSSTGAFWRAPGAPGSPGYGFSLDGANFGNGGHGAPGFEGSGGGYGRASSEGDGDGAAATAPGAGGGGAYADATTTEYAGGDAAAGIIIVEEFS